MNNLKHTFCAVHSVENQGNLAHLKIFRQVNFTEFLLFGKFPPIYWIEFQNLFHVKSVKNILNFHTVQIIYPFPTVASEKVEFNL